MRGLLLVVLLLANACAADAYQVELGPELAVLSAEVDGALQFWSAVAPVFFVRSDGNTLDYECYSAGPRVVRLVLGGQNERDNATVVNRGRCINIHVSPEHVLYEEPAMRALITHEFTHVLTDSRQHPCWQCEAVASHVVRSETPCITEIDRAWFRDKTGWELNAACLANPPQ